MLSAKNGVITEKRFRDLTEVQWCFHYLEVLKEKQKEQLKVESVVQKILSSIEMVGILANPKLAKKIIDETESRKGPGDASEKEKDLMESFNELRDLVPETIEIDWDKKSKTKFFLPKYKRKKMSVKVEKETGGDEIYGK